MPLTSSSCALLSRSWCSPNQLTSFSILLVAIAMSRSLTQYQLLVWAEWGRNTQSCWCEDKQVKTVGSDEAFEVCREVALPGPQLPLLLPFASIANRLRKGTISHLAGVDPDPLPPRLPGGLDLPHTDLVSNRPSIGQAQVLGCIAVLPLLVLQALLQLQDFLNGLVGALAGEGGRLRQTALNVGLGRPAEVELSGVVDGDLLFVVELLLIPLLSALGQSLLLPVQLTSHYDTLLFPELLIVELLTMLPIILLAPLWTHFRPFMLTGKKKKVHGFQLLADFTCPTPLEGAEGGVLVLKGGRVGGHICFDIVGVWAQWLVWGSEGVVGETDSAGEPVPEDLEV